MYRVPGFLATSLDQRVADRFLRRAVEGQGDDGVKWIIHLDPRGAVDPEYRCKHVNYVESTLIKGEDEFLFAPYSVFTVISTAWSDCPHNPKRPHVVHLEAALDNWDHPGDCETAPWS